ncbi:MAG: glycoside hydrolase family 99-like domain-containing protein [Bacteroides sp.]|nr:glycoside hydrolase family 99-like domain-containing protein [Bacteroides sp.]
MQARVIAMYLPQFHPIPENDEWWGKGFTEWTNVARAKPLFKGHYQPHVPADLGFYDLRVPEVREAQAQLARKAGIEGFCYYHYWFGAGNQLLERPFNEVLESGKPDFPFCLCWANHDWSNKLWSDGGIVVKEEVLMKQVYDEDDYIKHFAYVLPAFKDKRYMKIDGKPIFVIWHPFDLPDTKRFIKIWTELAKKNGLKGVYFIGNQNNMSFDDYSFKMFFDKKKSNLAHEKYTAVLDAGFDGVNSRGFFRAEFCTRSLFDYVKRLAFRKIFKKYSLSICKQSEVNKHIFVPEDKWENVYPTLFPNWDHSPRSGKRGRIYVGSTPGLFKEQVKNVLTLLEGRPEDHRVLFLQAWNEWGEGNHIEPDLKFGHGYIDALYEALTEGNN